MFDAFSQFADFSGITDKECLILVDMRHKAFVPVNEMGAKSAKAVGLFCYRILKQIRTFAAIPGGLETLVFTGGIGKHVPQIQRIICRKLRHLGVLLDEERKTDPVSASSPPGAHSAVSAFSAGVNLIIARHVYARIKTVGA